jgi:hypothetical protein
MQTDLPTVPAPAPSFTRALFGFVTSTILTVTLMVALSV